MFTDIACNIDKIVVLSLFQLFMCDGKTGIEFLSNFSNK